MLEEKNDNLPGADGSTNQENHAQDLGHDQPVDQTPDANTDLISETTEPALAEPIDAAIAKESKENDDVPEELLVDAVAETDVEPAPIPTETPNTDIIDEVVIAGPEADVAEPIDATFAKEGKINDDVPEDLVAETLEAETDENPDLINTEANNEIAAQEAIISEVEPIAEPAEMVNTIITEADLAVNAIAETNAEDSEDGSRAERREDLPIK